MKKSSFWLLELGCILQSFAFFLPPLWLPTFAGAIHLPNFAGTLGLALINLATCLGAVLVGLLVDRLNILVVIGIVTLGQVVAIFIFWGLTSTQGMFFTFALLWGVFGGGFSSKWSGYTHAVAKSMPNQRVEAGLMLSLMAAGRGVGAVITGPLSAKLLQVGWNAQANFAYGTDYGVLIVFSGVFAALGGTACVGRWLRVI